MPKQRVALDAAPRAVGEDGCERVEIHHAADGVAAVDERAGSEDDLGALQREGVHTDHVLQVAAAVDGVVHAHTVHDDQHAVGGETPDHGTAPALLALLHEDGARLRQHVGRRLRVPEAAVPQRHPLHPVGHLVAVLRPTAVRDDDLVEFRDRTVRTLLPADRSHHPYPENTPTDPANHAFNI